ncbi:MAG: SPOR domain-containing protein [Geminicoccaceae bacterium]|nr:SPOR domain-containing protein [Geminicoccaceae bacterium]
MRIMRWLVACVMIAVFGTFVAVIVMAFDAGHRVDGAPPLIKADATPFRQVPDERGGIAVLNEGSALVQALDRGPEPAHVERFLPPPEPAPKSAADLLPSTVVASAEPEFANDAGPAITSHGAPDGGPTSLASGSGATFDPERAMADGTGGRIDADEGAGPDATEPSIVIAALPELAATQTDDAPAPMTAAEPADADALPEALSSPEIEPAPSDVPVPAVAPGDRYAAAPSGALPVVEAPGRPAAGSIDVADIVDRSASPAASEPPARVAVPLTPGGFRVQIAAFRTPGQADDAWRQMNRRYPGLLDGLAPHVQEAQTDKGLFYRLQTAPGLSREAATDRCETLKRAGGDCFVVAGRS